MPGSIPRLPILAQGSLLGAADTIPTMRIWKLDALDPEPHQPEVLRSDEGAARVIVLALPQGESLQEHQVHEHAWLLLLAGELTVRSGGDHGEIAAGGLVHFDPAERREVQARSDARLLLILAPWPGEGHPSQG